MGIGHQAFSALRRIGIVALIAITFLFGLTATVYLSLRSPEVKVPEVVGKDRFEAERILANAELNFRVRATRPSNQVNADTVLFQMPRAGEVVKVGQTVAMDISRSAKAGETPEAVVPDEKADDKAADKADNKRSKEDTASNRNSSESALGKNDNENRPKKNKNTNKNANDNANANANANAGSPGANTNRTPANANEVNTRPREVGNNANDNANANANANANIGGPASQNENKRPPAPRPSPTAQKNNR